MKILPTLNIQSGFAVPIFGTAQKPCDPMDVIHYLHDLGCHRLALVDVDAARGAGHNRDLIARIMQHYHRHSGKVCIQVGGGIRSSDQAQYYLDKGATWLLVGTILHRSPLVVDQLLARFRDNLTAGVDARGGEIQAAGWGEPARLAAESTGERIRSHGFKRILFMDIPTSPSAAPDFQTARIISNNAHIPLFMGGSIQRKEHLQLALNTPGLQGIAMDALLLREDPSLLGSMSLSHF